MALKSVHLTSLQEELWLSHLGLPDGHPGISCGCRFGLNGVPDIEVLKKSIVFLVKQFPLLSATLKKGEGLFPVFELGVWKEPEFEYIDLGTHPDPESACEIDLRRLIEKPFQPIGGRLCRFALIRLGPEKSIFYSHYFHIVADGFACVTHFNVISSIYKDLLKGKEVKLIIQDWQEDVEADQKHIASKRYEKDIAFWQEYCKSIPEESLFYPLYGKPNRIGKIESFQYDISPQLMKKIERFSADNSVTPANIFTALHLLTLSLLLDRERMVVQIPFRYGKSKNEWEIHGHRVNVVPFWIDIGEETTFKTLLTDVRHKMLSLLRRSRTPFQRALRQIGRLSELKHIWDTSLAFFGFKISPRLGDDVQITYVEPIVSQFEPSILECYANELMENSPIRLSVYYSTNHFTEKDIENYCKRLEQVAEKVLESPEKRVRDICILLPEEREKLSHWQKGKSVPYIKEDIPSLFERISLQYSKKIAVEGNGTSLTYEELYKRANAIASWLCHKGICAGKVVAVLARRHVRLPETILGIMRSGGVYLPIDPDYPEDRIAYMISDSGASKIIALIPDDVSKYKGELAVELIPEDILAELPFKASSTEAAYLIYTSGSTGKPKGVLVSHKGFINMILSQIDYFGITSKDRVLQFASPSFDASLSEIFMALLSGATLFPVDRELIDYPDQLRDFMEKNKISVVTFPPPYLRLFDKKDFSSLRVLITAGEAPVYEDAEYYRHRLEYFNAYGPTEASVCATIMRFSPDDPLDTGKIGRPIPNTEAYVLNRYGYPVPPGIPGELCLGGAGIALGYINRESLNKEKFINPPFDPKKRLYKTGDLAFWSEDGNLILLGRIDEQVKVRGYRIEPGEIGVCLERLPEIAKAEVVAIPDAQGEKELVAFLVLREGYNRPDIQTIRNKLLNQLPAFMIPSRFFWLDKMPFGPTGKIDRKRLAKIAKEKIERQKEAYSSYDNLNEMEQKIASIFQDILGVKPSSPQTDFFTLGGDSIKIIELTDRLNKAFQKDISTRDVFSDPTIRGIASRIAERETSKTFSKTEGSLPLNQGQHQLWVLNQLNPESPQYNMPFVLEIESHAFGWQDFNDAILKAIKRQPLYNCIIDGEIDRPRLKILNSFDISIKNIDLSNENDPERVCEGLFNKYIHHPFDLTISPPIRILLARLNKHIWRLLIVQHHIIGDGASLHILVKDFAKALAGMELKYIAPGHIAYFAESEKGYLGSKDFQEDLLWWRHYLTPLPHQVDLVNRPRPDIKHGKGEMITLPLSRDISENLVKLGQHRSATLFTAFITLVLDFLAHETGKGDIAIGVPINLRDTLELQEVAGYFVNTVVIRKRFKNSSALIEKVEETAKDFVEVLKHGRIPFVRLAESIGKGRDPSRSPLVDILVTLIDERDIFEGASFPKEMAARPVRIPLQASKLDFTFILYIRLSGEMDIVLEYDRDIASKEDANLILRRFERFLHHSLDGPDIREDYAEANDEIAEKVLNSWEKVLGKRGFSLDSNFFSFGGDSIKAIQIVGELRRQGIHGIKPSDIFSYPILKELIRLAKEEPELSHKGEGRETFNKEEPLPLLPMQHWLLRHHPRHWRNFFMVLPVKLKVKVDISRLKQAVKELPARHESLRVKFSDQGKPFFSSPIPAPLFEQHSSSEPVLKKAIQDGVEILLNKMDPISGRTFGVVLLKNNDEEFLIIGGHHLVLDAISLDILCHELLWFCKHEKWPEIEDKSSPFLWASRLLANKELWEVENDKWHSLCSRPSFLKAIRKGEDRVSLRISLSEKVVGANELADTRTGILASFSQALFNAGEKESILLALEGHGRENIFPDIDISQGVGWFTITYPMPLTPHPIADQAVYEIEQWFKDLRYGGLGYSVLSMLKPDQYNHTAQIGFNYLGTIKEEEDFIPLPHLATPFEISGLLHPDFRSDTPLELVVYKTGSNELILNAWFSPYRVDKGWVELLLQSWKDVLIDKAGFPKPWNEVASICDCSPSDIKYIFDPLPQHEAMIYQYQLEGEDSFTYSQQITFSLKGTLDTAKFMEAWHLVAERHDGLKGIFPVLDTGEIKWVILKKGRSVQEYIDLSYMPRPSQEEELKKRRPRRTFSLEQGPLLYMSLFKLSEDDFEMTWDFHHILMDGWCIGILIRELFSFYRALVEGRRVEPDPAPSLQSYITWYRQQDEERAKRFWKEYLSGLEIKTPVLSRGEILSADASHDNAKHRIMETVEFYLEEEIASSLSSIASHSHVTISMLLQCAWAIVIASLQGSIPQRVLFGLVTSGRPSEVKDIESMVGLFIQTVPVKIELILEEAFSEFIKREQENSLKRMEFEFFPLSEIQRCSPIEGPLFDHALVFENYPIHGIEQEGAPTIKGVSGIEQHPYDMGVSVIYDKSFTFRFSFYPDVVNKEYISSLFCSMEAILRKISEQEDTLCSELINICKDSLKVAFSGARYPWVDAFNKTVRSYPRDISIDRLFIKNSKPYKDLPALEEEDGRCWTYQKLDEVSSCIASQLGILEAGEPVAIAMKRGPEAIAAILGILRAGGCYMPLDLNNPLMRLRSMLEKANCRKVIYDSSSSELLRLDSINFYHFHELSAYGKSEPINVERKGLDPAYIMFTSGTTGLPKGVIVPHRAIARLVFNNGFLKISSDDTILQAAPLAFDASTFEIWAALLNGAKLSIIPDEILLDPAGFKAFIRDHSISVMWLTASLCNVLIEEDASMFDPIRVLLTGGEPLSVPHIKRLMQACPDLTVINGYGPTENTVFTTTHHIRAEDLEGDSVPIGKPIGNTRVYIFKQDGGLASIGEWGEIYAAGDGLALGYIGDEEENKRSFVKLPLPFDERAYKTGDIGRWRKDGVIEFKGRRDHQIKIRGYRIELDEIENAILGIRGVFQTVVLAFGEADERRLVAFIRADKSQLSEDILKKELGSLLPPYMIPDEIFFLDLFPITANGKIDRSALQERFIQLSEGKRRRQSGAEDIEEVVTEIFSEILQKPISSAQKGIDFFRLGGQSLKAMRLLMRINKRFNIRLSLRDILTNSTVFDLSKKIKEIRSYQDDYSAIEAIEHIGEMEDYPMSSTQERLWFLQCLQPHSSAYNIPFAISLEGNIDLEALKKALLELEKRHDALRIRVPRPSAQVELRQKIARHGAFRLVIHDFSESEDPISKANSGIEKELATPFSFGYNTPLIRASLFRIDKNKAILLLIAHHLICDGVSSEIILNDLRSAYEEYCRQKGV